MEKVDTQNVVVQHTGAVAETPKSERNNNRVKKTQLFGRCRVVIINFQYI